MDRRKRAPVEQVQAHFDARRFWSDIERVIRERSENWHRFAQAIGVPGIYRTKDQCGDNPHINTVLAAATWSGLKLDDYIKVDPTPAEKREEAQ